MVLKVLFLLSRGLFSISGTGLIFTLYWGRPQAGDGAFHIPFFLVVNILGLVLWLAIEHKYGIRFNAYSGILQMILSAALSLLSAVCIMIAGKFGHDVFMGFRFIIMLFKD